MNNNIQEDYCSSDITYLLLKYGFNVNCPKPIPTHALAIKWIRENFHIYPTVGNVYSDWSKWAYSISSEKEGIIIAFREGQGNYKDKSKEFFNSPEKATEAAILYILENLI